MTPNPQLPTGAPGASTPRTSGLAIGALITGIIGACMPCPFGLVSIPLGIVALVKMKDDPKLSGRGMAIAGIAIPLVALVVVMPIMAAIAIPNFIKFQARAKQAECKANLAALYVAERSYFAEHDTYSTRPSEVGFEVGPGNLYAYFLGTEQERPPIQGLEEDEDATAIGTDIVAHLGAGNHTTEDIPPALAGDVRVGVTGNCPECSFTAVCIGNLDNDLKLDVWSISTVDRTGPNGQTIGAGQPFNEVNDVTE